MRANHADEDGNLSVEEEAMLAEILPNGSRPQRTR